MRPVRTILAAILVYQPLAAQEESDIVVLSIKVGSTIDAAENALMKLFPDVEGFESAQFYKMSENRYLAKIVYVDRTRRKLKKRRYSWEQFHRLKYRAGSHPVITEEKRAQQLDYLTYLRTHNIMEDIPTSTFCTIKHENGQRFTGTFVKYENREITFQSLTKRFKFPIEELVSITYRPFADDGQIWKKWAAFGIGAVVGTSFAEIWNSQKSPRIDIVWYNRFLGMGLGFLFGSEIFEAISVITSPAKVIALTPEELAKIN
ncbi:MAG: hypothetical protein CMG71_06380 [Candidatus Marinimicrobia bacterium]|nr:hypothetical protein [Candidatus Neomarinimicrobiota bacterium]